MQPSLKTQRLVIRPFTLDDAAFIYELLNEPSFIENIADKGIQSIQDAEHYLENGPLAAYKKFGCGLLRVSTREHDQPIGMCGLVNRPELPGPDLGYALIPEFWRQGFITEASRAVIADGFSRLGLKQILAITKPENVASNHVLLSLGFVQTGTIDVYDCENNYYSLNKSEI